MAVQEYNACLYDGICCIIWNYLFDVPWKWCRKCMIMLVDHVRNIPTNKLVWYCCSWNLAMFIDKYKNNRKCLTPSWMLLIENKHVGTLCEDWYISEIDMIPIFVMLQISTKLYQTGKVPHQLTSPWVPDSDIEIRPQGTKASPGASGTEWWDCWHWDGDSYWPIGIEGDGSGSIKCCSSGERAMLQCFYYPVNLELGWSVEEQGSTIEQL